MATSPTARTLAYCRRQGWHAGVTEKWIEQARIRRDLFGCFDLVCVEPRWIETTPEGERLAGGGHILGVQACAAASHAARVAKVAAAPVLADWIAAGGIAEVWSWALAGPRGKRKRWTLRRERVEPAAAP